MKLKIAVSLKKKKQKRPAGWISSSKILKIKLLLLLSLKSLLKEVILNVIKLVFRNRDVLIWIWIRRNIC
jgi:hypothetical protein